MLPPFTLLRPSTLDDALGMLSEDRVPYCGGTELLLAMRAGLYRPATLVDIKRVPELYGVSATQSQIRIGAVTTHREIAGHPLIKRHLPMLCRVEQSVGNPRVRAQGSIGGNLCFAEPKSDVAAALMAHRATVTIASSGRTRELMVADFFRGPYFADREPGELLVSINVPVVARQRATYVKYQTMERPTVGVGVVHEPEVPRCCVVVGAVGEIPIAWDFSDPAEVDPDLIAAECDPIPDLGGSVRYKRHVVAVYVRRALEALAKEPS